MIVTQIKMGKKTIDVQILLQWVVGERFVILTPVIISMCQLMTDDCSYSSIIQGPESEGERWTLHKLKLSWYWQLPGYYTVHSICINNLYRTVCNWIQSKLINGGKLKICCHFADFIHCFFVVTIVLQLPFVRTVLTKVGGSFGKYTVLAEDGSFISVF